jgi:predicted MPP superfamily phosphohydrolase
LIVCRNLLVTILFVNCAMLLRAQPQPCPANSPVEIKLPVTTPFHFVAYGDARFHDPKDTAAADATVRQALVQEIAKVNPAFIAFTGDIVYNGDDNDDWKVWDRETTAWRASGIPVFPALGNHDLHGNERVAMANYFQHFPDLHGCRYYSVRAANSLLLVMDSALGETSDDQGRWLAAKLNNVPGDVDFVLIVLHHPPYTSSSDLEMLSGGGHSARSAEQRLAWVLEARQKDLHARIVVFSGHVHNYERHEHGGVTYFVTGGAGAHPYPIRRKADDLFRGGGANYHYLLAEVDRGKLKVTMHRIDMTSGKPVWTEPDSVTISIAATKSAGQGK